MRRPSGLRIGGPFALSPFTGIDAMIRPRWNPGEFRTERKVCEVRRSGRFTGNPDIGKNRVISGLATIRPELREQTVLGSVSAMA